MLNKVIRVFPRRNKWTPDDNLSFIGYPPLIRPDDIPVHISVTFTQDKELAEMLYHAWSEYYSDVSIGGPAFDDPGGEFIPGRYIKQGVVITSRGCPNYCPWCFVPKRESVIRELPIKNGWIIQDNNLLACNKNHIIRVFDMLRHQPHPAEFKGGFDSRLLRPWHIDLLKSIKLNELWFACDTKEQLPTLEKAADLLKDFPRSKKRCYVMVGYDGESLDDALLRLRSVYQLGFDPFCQLYQSAENIEYSFEWKDFARYWSRPAIYRV